MKITVLTVVVLGLMAAATATAVQSSDRVYIGSKKFTESVILGEMAYQLAQATGSTAQHNKELGGTRVLWGALVAGDLDIYPEYSGTLIHEILVTENIETEAQLHASLASKGIKATPALGFNNTYAIGVTQAVARQFSLHTISDLRRQPDLVFGFGNEFMDRADGWPGLRQHYGLPQANVRGLDHDLAYRGLEAGSIQVMDMYSTDAEVEYYNLITLEDDLRYFPVYNALFLYRAELELTAPRLVKKLRQLAGRIDAAGMSAMNARVKIARESENTVAADFLEHTLKVKITREAQSRWQRIQVHTFEHLTLVAISLTAAIFVAIPLGVLGALHRRAGQLVLGATGMLQTVPSLALFVFMIPVFGIGGPPAVVALFLYSLLPIVRNTHAALTTIDPALRESACVLGLPRRTQLLRVDLPLGASMIMAGIKTAAVINVGTATLAALIGAGGYGQPILTGIRLDDIGLILEGAIPAALLALLAQSLFELAERWVVPRGLSQPLSIS